MLDYLDIQLGYSLQMIVNLSVPFTTKHNKMRFPVHFFDDTTPIAAARTII